MKNKFDTKTIVTSVLSKYDITPIDIKVNNLVLDDNYSRYNVDVKVDKPENLSEVSTTYKVINEIEGKLWDAGYVNPELTLTNVDY